MNNNITPPTAYQQFEAAIKKAPINHLLKATHVIAALREHKKILQQYNIIENKNLVAAANQLGRHIYNHAATENVESKQWEVIGINEEKYIEVFKNFIQQQATLNNHTGVLHYSGLIYIFTTAILYITDFLQGDKQYPVIYDEQNLNRALNQVILLQRLQFFLQQKGLLLQ
jgi:hypothetical protein